MGGETGEERGIGGKRLENERVGEIFGRGVEDETPREISLCKLEKLKCF